MELNQVRIVARIVGVEPGQADKMTLIRRIQRAEGAPDCFASTFADSCTHTGCRWRDDCMASYAAPRVAEFEPHQLI